MGLGTVNEEQEVFTTEELFGNQPDTTQAETFTSEQLGFGVSEEQSVEFSIDAVLDAPFILPGGSTTSLRSAAKTTEPLIGVLEIAPEILRRKFEQIGTAARKLFTDEDLTAKDITDLINPVTGFKEAIAAIKKVGKQGSIFGEITAGKEVAPEDMFGFLPETLERMGIPEGGGVNLPVIGRVSTRGLIGFLGEIALPSIPFAKTVKFAKAKKALKAGKLDNTVKEVIDTVGEQINDAQKVATSGVEDVQFQQNLKDTLGKSIPLEPSPEIIGLGDDLAVTGKSPVHKDVPDQAKFNGMQEMPEGGKLPVYTDTHTKSSFILDENERLIDKLTKVRDRFDLTPKVDETQMFGGVKVSGDDINFIPVAKEPVGNRIAFADIGTTTPEKAGNVVDLSKKQRMLFGLTKEKGISSETLNETIKDGFGVNDLKFTGNNAITESQLDEIIERVKKIKPEWSQAEKEHFMLNGAEPPNIMQGGQLALAEEGSELSPIRRAFRSMQVKGFQTVETSLRKLGKVGDELAERTLNAQQLASASTETGIRTVKQIFKNISNKDFKLIIRSYDDPSLVNGMSKKILDAKTEFDKLTEQYADLFEKLKFDTITKNGKKVPFKRRVNYWPHVYDANVFGKKKSRDRIVKRLMEKRNLTESEARAELDEIARFRKYRAEPNVEYERVFDAPGWIGDPSNPKFSKNQALLGLEKYIAGANRRVAEKIYFDEGGKVMFGSSTKTADELINSVASDDARRFMQQALKRIRGLDPASPERGLLQSLRNYQVIRRLPLAWIPNLMQPAVTVIPKVATLGFRRGFQTAFEGLQLTLKRNGRLAAKDTGAILEQTMRDVVGMSGRGLTGKGATIVMKWITPFSVTENLNNIYAANTGMVYFKRLVNIAAGRDKPLWFKTAMMNNALRDLKGLGLSPEKIKLIQNGNTKFINQDDINRAGWRLARQTQFRATPLDLPLFASTDWGRTLFQFKTFSINIGKLGWQHFAKPAARFVKSGGKDGSLLPMGVFLASAWGTGEIHGDVRSWISGRERPDFNDEFLKRSMENLWWAGSFGAYFDMYTAIMSGRAFETVLGPTIGGSGSEAIDLVRKFPAAIENEEVGELLKEFGVKQTPLVAQLPGLQEQILDQ